MSGDSNHLVALVWGEHVDPAEIQQLADSMAASTEILRSEVEFMQPGSAKDACLRATDWATKLASEVRALAEEDPSALSKYKTNRMIAEWREICAAMAQAVEQSGEESSGGSARD